MAVIVIPTRAPIVASAVLLLITIAPWHHAQHALSVPAAVSSWDARPELGPVLRGPLTIEIPRIPAAVPNLFDGLDHPDMRPWPAGMVMAPGPSGDRNVLGQRGVWDRLLSALLAPFASVSA